MRILNKKNLICALEAVIAIIAYILIDGLGIILTGYKFIAVNNEGNTGSVSDPLRAAAEQNLSGELSPSVLNVMADLYVARLAILFIVLFQIVFTFLRYRIKFSKNDSTGVKSLINYFRPVF